MRVMFLNFKLSKLSQETLGIQVAGGKGLSMKEVVGKYIRAHSTCYQKQNGGESCDVRSKTYLKLSI